MTVKSKNFSEAKTMIARIQVGEVSAVEIYLKRSDRETPYWVEVKTGILSTLAKFAIRAFAVNRFREEVEYLLKVI